MRFVIDDMNASRHRVTEAIVVEIRKQAAGRTTVTLDLKRGRVAELLRELDNLVIR
jgi:hypothetical protein